jgi:hypothetical protein
MTASDYEVIEAIDKVATEWVRLQRSSRSLSSHRVVLKYQRDVRKAGFVGTFPALWREVYEAGVELLKEQQE